MAVLTVGSGQQFSTLNAAIAASHDGDTIDVQAGTYVNDFATIWTKVDIVGVGGMVNLVATASPPNGKAILTTEADITLDHISFSGTAVADGNGAGVRYEGGNLAITNCYFHNNQEGILAAPSPKGSITIDHSEFADNGTETGYTHDIYINDIGKFAITNSYIHDALGGHEIKSRAEVSVIENNRIFDNGADANYSIDLPNGGAATIANNIIQQGPNSPNGNIIAYGEETSTPYANSQLAVTGNTIVNERGGFAEAVWNADGSMTAQIVDNRFFGLNTGEIASGPNTQSGNVFLANEPTLDTSHPWSTDASSVSTAIVGLYSAVFNRAPDLAGLQAWEAAATNGMSLEDIANGFSGSAEFRSHYPDMGPSPFLTELYQTAFGRAPDAAGLAGWTNALQHGASTADVLLGFANSAENIAKVAAHGWLFAS